MVPAIVFIFLYCEFSGHAKEMERIQGRLATVDQKFKDVAATLRERDAELKRVIESERRPVRRRLEFPTCTEHEAITLGYGWLCCAGHAREKKTLEEKVAAAEKEIQDLASAHARAVGAHNAAMTGEGYFRILLS